MLRSQFAVYLGEEGKEGFCGFLAEENIFVILEIQGVYDKEKGREFLKKIKSSFLAAGISTLAEFDERLSSTIQKENFPLDFALAAGFLKDTIFYVKTIGNGEIYLKREDLFEKLLGNNQSASGFIQERDLIILTSSYFTKILNGKADLKRFLDHKKPNEIIEGLTPYLKGKEEKGIIALLVEFESAPTEEAVLPPSARFEDIFVGLRRRWLSYSLRLGKRKTLTLVLVFFLFLILIWSVVLGQKRRILASHSKEIQDTKTLVTQKLKNADEIAFVNLNQAQSFIADSRQALANLKQELGGSNQNDVTEIENLIDQEANKILKKEEKSASEFFDLTVDNAKAQGTKMYLDKDNLGVLDSNQGLVYVLSLTDKSLNRYKAGQIKNSNLFGIYQGVVYVYAQGDGIYKIDGKNNSQKVIDNDTAWGRISGIWIYQGNIYLLDKGKSQIYKYIPTDNGFSTKVSYFKTLEGVDLTTANSLSIDSSIYIGFPDKVLKYTAGVMDSFQTSYPGNVSLTKVFTSPDVQQVYVWDKTAAAIYVLGKDGSYVREIQSSILKKINDFVVYGNTIYLLNGSKIYSIGI